MKDGSLFFLGKSTFVFGSCVGSPTILGQPGVSDVAAEWEPRQWVEGRQHHRVTLRLRQGTQVHPFRFNVFENKSENGFVDNRKLVVLYTVLN